MRSSSACCDARAAEPTDSLRRSVETYGRTVFDAQPEGLEQNEPGCSFVAEWSRLHADTLVVDLCCCRVRQSAAFQRNVEQRRDSDEFPQRRLTGTHALTGRDC